jgi:protein FAM50
MSTGFTAPTADASAKLAAATVGLVTKEEFTKRREQLEAAEQSEASPGAPKKKKKKAKAASSSLSFADDEEAEEETEVSKKPKLKKNPNVDTSMLFDADREAEVARKKEELARVWKEEQDAIKAELVAVTYSYHDPSGRDGQKGHRNTAEMPKGSTIEQFLNKCREQCPQLRSAAADQLIYVKEDLIMPHSMTFYELIINKARGKSGPLFNFDVHDDVRTVNDVRVEKDESHPGKVMFRSVYERLKDKFPYSRFEVYDPEKKWDTYTTHGRETYGEGNEAKLSAVGVMR